MRIQIPIVVEMTDDQVREYADEYTLNDTSFKTIREDVRSYVLTCIQNSPAFAEIDADVTIKR
jgi:hypothetical protein